MSNMTELPVQNREHARQVLENALEMLAEYEIDSAAVLLFSRKTKNIYMRCSKDFSRLEVIGAVRRLEQTMLDGEEYG